MIREDRIEAPDSLHQLIERVITRMEEDDCTIKFVEIELDDYQGFEIMLAVRQKPDDISRGPNR